MTKADTWAFYFAGVAALRCHPRNLVCGQDPSRELTYAAKIADAMILITQENNTCRGYSEEPPYSAEYSALKANGAQTAPWPPTHKHNATGKNE